MDQKSAVTALLATPSIDALIYALRHPETWPEGFEWDYSDCDHCALGVAMCLWNILPCLRDAARVLGMQHYTAAKIFALMKPRSTITPEHVAAALERYQATREAVS